MGNGKIIINACLPGFEELQQVEINECGIINQIKPSSNHTIAIADKQVIDLQGDWLSLGGIDLQINGALGLAFPDLQPEDLPKLSKICDFLWSQGVDGFLPTIVTTSVEKIQNSLATIDKFINSQTHSKKTAQIIGVHLEGPFLNYEKRGAHPAEYLLPLTIENLQQVLGSYQNLVKVITLAPELDSSGTTIAHLHSQGIVISLGHSTATDEQAKTAFKLGASMVTHAFNAMPSLHHRQAGLLGEAIINSSVFCGLIADGNHVCSSMMKILLAASNYEQGIFLVSDALAPLGLPDGIYPWDSREIEIKSGTAKLADGTLAGTTLPLLAGVNNLVEWEICSLEKAIAMATQSPRQAIGLSGIAVGQPANLLRWHWDETEQNLTWQRLDI
ncbi:N-acetylglucosamine 6-phosphate deacetylase [Stanieria cyanosphaera PCC 7437]|uniref:N-acetylglucosamine 6-phosphate deacetylase n=1 Tax=Stanieria cyanosphaera (strain ATCC 29371 / PCC 7437) TaxID=111780 RepID=K9XTI1_STAC7|nr:N-acetylglucosamine-6-phosphate deacetylase [Stanieria cyanosphaera]AFZ35369.1 N-acetylglucosamine 6-phosphate deacetylase [Stanieria cyanosphaera PCC 7437]